MVQVGLRSMTTTTCLSPSLVHRYSMGEDRRYRTVEDRPMTWWIHERFFLCRGGVFGGGEGEKIDRFDVIFCALSVPRGYILSLKRPQGVKPEPWIARWSKNGRFNA
jgi:hypothetical protein